jgi:hypothetical protein
MFSLASLLIQVAITAGVVSLGLLAAAFVLGSLSRISEH